MTGRHIYRIYFKNGITKDIHGKESLINTLNFLKYETIDKILWYKSNGFWIDKTGAYLK